MTSLAIEPTVTQQVRSFLEEQAVDIEPWSGLDETYGELYALLNQRKEDPAFWPQLSRLLDGILHSAMAPGSPDRLSAPQAELMASWDVDALITDLRAALPGGTVTRDPTAIQQFASRLSSAVMGGFLLLGLAAASGCSDDTDAPAKDAATKVDSAADMKTPASDNFLFPDQGPWFAKCNLAQSSVLYGAIDKSTLHNADKANLCGCFETLNKSWADGLTSLFQTGTAKEIADALTHMVTCCSGKKSDLNSDFNAVKSSFLKSQLCKGVPIYKGVSFPRE